MLLKQKKVQTRGHFNSSHYFHSSNAVRYFGRKMTGTLGCQGLAICSLNNKN